jgi:hypothetical protein
MNNYPVMQMIVDKMKYLSCEYVNFKEVDHVMKKAISPPGSFLKLTSSRRKSGNDSDGESETKSLILGSTKI